MRKADIYISSLRISNAIRESGLDKLFQAFLSPNAKLPQPTEVLEAFRQYTLASAQFGPNETKILDTFKLSGLSDPDFWANIISKSSEKRKEVVEEIAQNWNLYSEMLPRLLDLITPDDDIFKKLSDDAERRESNFVAVILLESQTSASTPERISKLMDSVSALHGALADLRDTSSELSVAFCDSGSDKEFIFAAAKEIAKQLRELLQGVIEDFLYHKERKIDKRIKIVSSSIPVLETIEAHRAKLGDEKTEILERVIMEGVTSFLETGAVLRDVTPLDEASRKLLQSQRKLLTHVKEENKPLPKEGG